MAHALPRDAYFTVETTFGEDQTDWPTNGKPIKIIEPDFELTRSEEENENITPRRQAVLDLVRGLKNGSTLSHGLYMTAAGVNAADQAQAVATNESDILRSGIGGRRLGYRSDLDGAGTAAAPSMIADPGYVAGDWAFGWDDSASAGRFVRIESMAGVGPFTANLLDPLLDAPAVGDVLYACITIYPDELAHDHTSANYTTLGWLLQGEDTDDVFALRGCKPSVGIEGIAAGERVRYTLDYLVADWPDVMPAKQTIAGAPSGIAPLTVGTGSKATILIGDVGSPLAGLDCRGTVEIDLGITWEQLPGPCSDVQGIKGYISSITPATLTLRAAFDDPSFVAEYLAGTKKHCLIQLGDQPTNATAIYFGELEYMERPQRADEGGETITELMFRAHEDPGDTTGLADPSDDLQQRRAPWVLLHSA
jgi:hypothetical protein